MASLCHFCWQVNVSLCQTCWKLNLLYCCAAYRTQRKTSFAFQPTFSKIKNSRCWSVTRDFRLVSWTREAHVNCADVSLCLLTGISIQTISMLLRSLQKKAKTPYVSLPRPLSLSLLLCFPNSFGFGLRDFGSTCSIENECLVTVIGPGCLLCAHPPTCPPAALYIYTSPRHFVQNIPESRFTAMPSNGCFVFELVRLLFEFQQ